MTGYRLTPRARGGLTRIVLHVEERFGSRVADRVVDRLESSFEPLAQHPDIGHQREDSSRDEEVRFWAVGPSLLAYRRGNEGVEILFVERGELDWERLMEEDF